MPEHLTVAQVAKHLSVSEKTIRRLIREGELQATRIGPRALRVSQPQLQSFLERRRT